MLLFKNNLQLTMLQTFFVIVFAAYSQIENYSDYHFFVQHHYLLDNCNKLILVTSTRDTAAEVESNHQGLEY